MNDKKHLLEKFMSLFKEYILYPLQHLFQRNYLGKSSIKKTLKVMEFSITGLTPPPPVYGKKTFFRRVIFDM